MDVGVSYQSRIGTAGEYLVCADLLARGFNAVLANAAEPYDVIVDLGKGIFKRIQVKTCSKPNASKAYYYRLKRTGVAARLRPNYSIDLNSIDHVALVALDTKLIAYLPVSNDLVKQHNITFREFGDYATIS